MNLIFVVGTVDAGKTGFELTKSLPILLGSKIEQLFSTIHIDHLKARENLHIDFFFEDDQVDKEKILRAFESVPKNRKDDEEKGSEPFIEEEMFSYNFHPNSGCLLTEEDLVEQKYSLAVFFHMQMHALIRFNEFCHSLEIPFVNAYVFGLVGGVFFDGGNNAKSKALVNENIEIIPECSTEIVSLDETGLIEVDPNCKFCFEENERVLLSAINFSDVTADASKLNGQMFPILRCWPERHCLKVDLAVNVDDKRKKAYLKELKKAVSAYKPGTGVIDKVKMNPGQVKIGKEKTKEWQTLRKVVLKPHSHQMFTASVWPRPSNDTSADKSPDVHATLCGISAFTQRHNSLPSLEDMPDAAEVLSLSQEYLASNVTVNKSGNFKTNFLMIENYDDKTGILLPYYARVQHPLIQEIVVDSTISAIFAPEKLFEPGEQQLLIDSLSFIDASELDNLPTAAEVLDDRRISKQIKKQFKSLREQIEL